MCVKAKNTSAKVQCLKMQQLTRLDRQDTCLTVPCNGLGYMSVSFRTGIIMVCGNMNKNGAVKALHESTLGSRLWY